MESREAEACSRSQSHTTSAALPKLRSGKVHRASLGLGRHAPAWKAPRAPRDTVHLEALGVVHRKEACPVNGSMVNVARRLAVCDVRRDGSTACCAEGWVAGGEPRTKLAVVVFP
jgi:hypothetical protein